MGFSKLAIAVGLVGLFSPVSVYAVCDASTDCISMTAARSFNVLTLVPPTSGAGASCTTAQHRVITKLEVKGNTAGTDTFTVETKAGTKTLTGGCSTDPAGANGGAVSEFSTTASCGTTEFGDVTTIITCTAASNANCNIKLGVTWACVALPESCGSSSGCADVTPPYSEATVNPACTKNQVRILEKIEVLATAASGSTAQPFIVTTIDSKGDSYPACSTDSAQRATGKTKFVSSTSSSSFCGDGRYNVTATISCVGSGCLAKAKATYACVTIPDACTTMSTPCKVLTTTSGTAGIPVATPYATVPSACEDGKHRVLKEIQVKTTDSKTIKIATKDSKGTAYPDCSIASAVASFQSQKACGLDSAYDVTATITCAASTGPCATSAYLDYQCVDIPAPCDKWCSDVAGGILQGKPITYVTKPAACPAGQHRIINEIQVKNTDETPLAFTVTTTDSNGTAYPACSTPADSIDTYHFQSQTACGMDRPFDVTATISCIAGTCKTKAFVDYKCVDIPAACTAGCQDKTIDAANVFNTTKTCEATKRRVVTAIQAKNKAGSTTTFTVETKDASGTIIGACSVKNATTFGTNAVCGDGKSDATTTIRCDGESCSVSLQVDYGCVDLVTAAPTPAPTPAPTTAAPKSVALLTTPSSSLIICLAIVALRYFGYEM